MFATNDFGALPIVKVTFDDSVPTDEEYYAYLEGQKVIYKLGVMGLLADGRNAKIPSRAHQQLQSKFLKEHKEEIQTYCVGYALVMKGRMLSILLNAIMSIYSSIVPYKIFDNLEDAEAWLHKMLLKRLGSAYTPQLANWASAEVKPIDPSELQETGLEPFAIIDQEEHPLVSITYTGTAPTDQSMLAFLQAHKSVLSAGRVAVLLDSRAAKIPPAQIQKQQADWLIENSELIRKSCIGKAYVVSDYNARNVLEHLLERQPPPVPYLVTDSLVEAEVWLRLQILKEQ